MSKKVAKVYKKPRGTWRRASERHYPHELPASGGTHSVIYCLLSCRRQITYNLSKSHPLTGEGLRRVSAVCRVHDLACCLLVCHRQQSYNLSKTYKTASGGRTSRPRSPRILKKTVQLLKHHLRKKSCHGSSPPEHDSVVSKRCSFYSPDMTSSGVCTKRWR